MSTSTLIVLAVIVVLVLWVITIYNGLVTRPPSPMEPHPPPGLFERVESIDDRLITVERNLAHRGFEGQMDPSGHVSGDITQNGVPEVKARTS